MRQVQTALANIGIPVMTGVWRTTSATQTSPPQYVVYSTEKVEEAYEDDHVQSYRTYVYLNLWSDTDPTAMASTIRNAMYAAGFWMIEESDRGYNQPAYETDVRRFTVQWTWCYREEVS